MTQKKINKTRADRLGLTQFVMVGKKKCRRYDWHAIFELWQDWPDAKLQSFARAYEIPYNTIVRRDAFNHESKQLSMAKMIKPFRKRVQDALKINIASAGNAESMRAIVKDMTEAAHAHSIVIRSHSVKEMPNGDIIANAALKPSEVRNLSEALKNTAQVMKEVLFLNASVPSDSTDDEILTEPNPVVGKIGA